MKLNKYAGPAMLLLTEMCIRDRVTPQVFAYPYGFSSPEATPVLKSMGFVAALTCKERVNRLTGDPDQLYDLGRFNRPSGVSTQAFMDRVGLR